jgi:hypothetical protein
MEKVKSNCQKKRSLDTLELTRDFSNKNDSETTLQLRRNSKAITTAMNGKLCYIDSVIHKDYQAAYYCNQYIFQDGNKIISKYCKKRSCLICCRIMAARLFQAYSKPLLEELKDLHMVTLTAPTVPANQLKKEIANRYNIFTKIRDNFRKTYGIKIKGFRKLEITYNLRTKEFHPHYHILIEGRQTAELIKRQWLKLIPNASEKAQNIKKVDSNGLFEVFKYVTKAIVKDTFNTKALDTMYVSLKGVRTYQSFGIKKTQEVKIDKYESLIISHKTEKIDVWKWCNNKNDWYTSEGEQLNKGELKKDTKKAIKIINKHETLEKRKDSNDKKEYNVNSGFKRPPPAEEGSRINYQFDGFKRHT